MANYIFAPEQAEIFKISRKEKSYNQSFKKVLRGLIWFLGAVTIMLWLIDILKLVEVSSAVLGLSLIIISTAAVLLMIHSFKVYLFRYIPKVLTANSLAGENINLAEYLSLDAAKVISAGRREAQKRKQPSLNTIVLFLALLKNQCVLYILARAGINLPQFSDDLQTALSAGFGQGEKGEKTESDFTNSLIEAVKLAADFALTEKHRQVEVADIFYGLSQTDEFLKKVFFAYNLKTEDLANIVYWENSVFSEQERRKKFISPEFWSKTGGIGREWSFGYVPNLEKYSADISESIKRTGLGLHIIGHNREIRELERILSRSGKNNVLLIGEPGVGKKTAVLGFVQQILKDRAARVLRYKRLVQLDLGRLLAGDPAQIEAKMVVALNDAVSAGDIILFVEDIHSLFGGGQSKIGAVDASEVLIPYLQSSNLQLIGTTTFADYHKFIESSSSLAANFEKIEVSEPDEAATIRILEDTVPFIEGRNKVLVSYRAISEIVKLSKRYIVGKPFPEKAIDLLDEVAVYVALKTKDKMVLPEHVQKIVSEKTKIPTGEVEASEKEKLLNLEQFLHQRVIDQEEAIKSIAEAMRRARAGLKTEDKPIGSFLFLGPTGVGKTETARALAESFFGSEKSMSRLDMSEYRTPQSQDRLIGTVDGGEGVLTYQIKENPYCLLLLDEIEKAHPDVLNLFLQVLDEGRLTDRLGRTVDFSNAIIIATSNAGAELIRESVKAGEAAEMLREKLLEYLQRQGIFRPEFLNRFDGVISFKPLTVDEIYQVAELMLKKIAANLKQEKEIELVVQSPAVRRLAQLGYNPEMGARPMQRVITDKVENWLAERLLRGDIKKGDRVEFSEKDIA